MRWGEGTWANRTSISSFSGELVFTTGMVGYTETLTDPSYAGQIIIFSYPLIGNYGVPVASREGFPNVGFESRKIQAAGAIVGWASPDHSHWSAQTGLMEWMDAQGVGLLGGVDTRALIQWMRERRRRERASVLGLVQNADLEKPLTHFRDPGEEIIWPQVSVQQAQYLAASDPHAPTVALIDCGVKWNIIRQLQARGVALWILPWDTDFAEWFKVHPEVQGLLLSNGPGDPERAGPLIRNIRGFLREGRALQFPILGICLGHQILSLAAGARTERMDYGHRSHNQPVFQVDHGQIASTRGWLTSQNHGYGVLESSLESGWSVWFKNANDHSVEGVRHDEQPWRSVQFHPEAAGGPRDTAWILEEFIRDVKGFTRGGRP